MANYQIPPDPREKGNRKKRPSSPGDRPPIPWLWLGLGIVVSILGVWLTITAVNAFLFREPLAVATLQPTLIVLTAPPSVTPSPLPGVPTPTAIPTITPIPTPNVAVAPESITIGYFARIINTEGVGLTIRGGPSVNNLRILVAEEDSPVFILDGPTEGNDLLWWNVRLRDGTEGWAAADYLEPIAAPADWPGQ